MIYYFERWRPPNAKQKVAHARTAKARDAVVAPRRQLSQQVAAEIAASALSVNVLIVDAPRKK